MATGALTIAWIFPSFQETVLILIVGIMLFGRRLPEVGRAVAKTIIKMRQGLNKLKEEMNLDEEVQDFKDSIRGVKDELTDDFSEVRDFAETIDKPRRALKDPGKMLMDLTDESLSVPSPTAIRDDLEQTVRGALNGEPTSDTNGDVVPDASVEEHAGTPESADAPKGSD